MPSSLEKEKQVLAESGQVYFRVKALPGSTHTGVMGTMSDGTIKIAIAAQAEKNRANSLLTKFLAEEFSVDNAQVDIISGASGRIKLIRIKKD